MNKLDSTTLFLLIIIAIFLGALIFFFVLQYIVGFFQELRFINSEISRNRGDERKYWKNRKKRLFISLIPFVKYK